MNDLEWLARNLHKWCDGYDYVRIDRDESITTFLTRAEIILSDCDLTKIYSGKQWADERQRLQNKPSWDYAPDWAEWLAQSGGGVWRWYEDKPHLNPGYDSYQTTRHKRRTFAETGKVLGDWRETLEGRATSADSYQSDSVERHTLRCGIKSIGEDWERCGIESGEFVISVDFEGDSIVNIDVIERNIEVEELACLLSALDGLTDNELATALHNAGYRKMEEE